MILVFKDIFTKLNRKILIVLVNQILFKSVEKLNIFKLIVLFSKKYRYYKKIRL